METKLLPHMTQWFVIGSVNHTIHYMLRRRGFGVKRHRFLKKILQDTCSARFVSISLAPAAQMLRKV